MRKGVFGVFSEAGCRGAGRDGGVPGTRRIHRDAPHDTGGGEPLTLFDRKDTVNRGLDNWSDMECKRYLCEIKSRCPSRLSLNLPCCTAVK